MKERASGFSSFTVTFKDPLFRKTGKGEVSRESSSSTTKKEMWIMRWEAFLIMGRVDPFDSSISKRPSDSMNFHAANKILYDSI